MSVYVDDMRAPYGRMVMCHCIADTTEELLTMMNYIGVQRKWIQDADTYSEHFDISLAKKALAVKAGAIEVTSRELVARMHMKRPSAERPAWALDVLAPALHERPAAVHRECDRDNCSSRWYSEEESMANGTIKRLLLDKGFGFIADQQTGVEYFFHRSALDRSQRFELLKEGTVVTFTPGEGQKGPRAEDVRAE